jgi:hypothetical protein
MFASREARALLFAYAIIIPLCVFAVIYLGVPAILTAPTLLIGGPVLAFVFLNFQRRQ